MRILCGFLKNEELGLSSRQALRLQEKVVQERSAFGGRFRRGGHHFTAMKVVPIPSEATHTR